MGATGATLAAETTLVPAAYDTRVVEGNYKLTVTISSISLRLMYPLPSKSYIENAQRSFCSSFPLEVTESAHKNSLKSMVPSPLASKVRNTCSANCLINEAVRNTLHAYSHTLLVRRLRIHSHPQTQMFLALFFFIFL